MTEKTHARGAEADAKAHLQKFGIYGSSVAVVSNIFRISNIIRNHAENNLLSDYGLSFSGFVTLWVLWVWGPMETHRLAGETGVAKSTLTGILKTLEKSGYCERRPHPKDGRRVVVNETDAGRTLMEEIFPLFHQIEDQAVADLSAEEMEHTKDGLRIILNTVEKSAGA